LTAKEHILILPRWYPNRTDIQLGSFIQHQAILLKENYHVHVIYVQAVQDQTSLYSLESQSSNGIDEQLVYFKSAKGPLKKIINANRYKKAQKMAYELASFSPSLCHIHVPYRSAILALALNKKGVPFVITEHWSGHLTGDYQNKNQADQRLYKSVLGRSAGIATVSQLLQYKFRENTGFNSVVIPNIIQEIKSSSPSKSDYIQLLSVSDFTDEVKNISGLVKAFQKAFNERKDLRLVVIGGGPDEEKIKKLIRDLGLTEQIELRGRLAHSEVLQAYQQCHFYICNSNFETFGMAVAEAIVAGRPVISTKCGGPEEFVNEKNGLLINVNSHEDLKNAILNLSNNHAGYESHQMSQEILNKFGSESIRQKLIEFYQLAIHDKKP
jgi:L-malate glycosyltransferase